jgi:hypothetical protein
MQLGVRDVRAQSSLLRVGFVLCSYIIISVAAYAHEPLGHGIENETKSIYIHIPEDVFISDITNEENTVIFPRLCIEHATAVAYIRGKRSDFFVWSIVTCDGAGQELWSSLAFRVNLIGHGHAGLNRPSRHFIDEKRGSTSIIDDLKSKLLASETNQEPTGWIYSNTRVDNFYEGEGTLQFNKRTFGHACGTLGSFRDNASEASLPSCYIGKHYRKSGNEDSGDSRDRAVMIFQKTSGVDNDAPEVLEHRHFVSGLIFIIGSIAAIAFSIFCSR